MDSKKGKDKTNYTGSDRAKKRHVMVWNAVTRMLPRILKSKFNYTFEEFDPGEAAGPFLVVANHSCAWDPLMVGAAVHIRHMYIVASEHILRWRVLGPVMDYLCAPIPRKKASSGAGTVMSCLRHLRSGSSVILFAEGEQSWNGRSIPVFPATGKLAKQSGAYLVTFRIEGAYLSLPRWAKGIRKGRVYGQPVNMYSPETLKSMTTDEVTDAIERDINFDVWQWQEEQPGGPVSFISRSRDTAAGLEKALYMCPGCGRTGTLRTAGSILSCDCGLRAEYTDTGILRSIGQPDADTYDGLCGRDCSIAEWDDWQTEELGRRAAEGGLEFSDEGAVLTEIYEGHKEQKLAEGTLSLRTDRNVLSVDDVSFDLEDIEMMAMVLSGILLLKTGKGYYQIRSEEINFRKYLHAWEYMRSSKD